MANGLVSHNSHAAAYAHNAIRCQYLKAHHLPQFVAAALAFEEDPVKRARIAAEARRYGVPVVPPDVARPRKSFSAVEIALGKYEVQGAVGGIKGIGPAAVEAIVERGPYASIVDFGRKLNGCRVTVSQFEALAKAGALRSLFSHRRILLTNARRIWKDAKRGVEWRLSGAEVIPDLTPEEEAAAAMEVYPLYADMAGRTGLDFAEEEVQRLTKQPLYTPADVVDGFERGEAALVLGRIDEEKEYTNSKGRVVTRLLMTGSDGQQVGVRVYDDVLRAHRVELRPKETVVAYLTCSAPGSAVVEWVSRASELGRTAVSQWLLCPTRTRPHDPYAAYKAAKEDSRFAVQGMVLRVRRHRDKNGSRMATVGLVGDAGFLRFFVFSRSYTDQVATFLAPGRLVRVTLGRLRDAAALANERSISALTLEGSVV